MADPSFLGSGPAFPFSVDAGGSVLLRHGTDKVEQSIRLILSTRIGERPMRPEFGCAAHEHVFAPAASPRTTGKVVRAVEDALTRWEPRIDLLSVTADPGQQEGVLVVEVGYLVRATNDVQNLVHPFYAIPPEPDGPGAVGEAGP
ncbi:GPW/gp25 family protein [Serinicoccus sediminis]|uniref:GPW/gp25 family protein n=1 Tax=Serinicoccus sediminis TaxID=2306021 RepID=UPI00101F506A|nr:GPW/gp25 family protein [Serinicoccus sediminis]